MPIPAVDFSEEIDKSSHIGDILNKELKIYVTLTEFFTTKFRERFKNTQITFKTSKYGRKWIKGPDLSFWPQQLNFALWCATTGCGISRDILFPTGYLDLSPQVRSFYIFHVYFTVELGGIESVSALPDDPTFKQRDNKNQIASYKKICGEFGINPNTDFRFTHNKNNGFGTVYMWVTYSGPQATDYHYPDPDLAMFDGERVTDITKSDHKANGIYFIRNHQGADKQFGYFVPNYSQGITYAGLARINQSIQAYCYCILGAQARTSSTIQGVSGGAIETQRKVLDRIEDYRS